MQDIAKLSAWTLACALAAVSLRSGSARGDDGVDAGPPRVTDAGQEAPDIDPDAPTVTFHTTVHALTPGRELQQSAAAVKVVDVHQAQEQAADLGEVLARTEGVSVQRSGGLGSEIRFSMNGLTDDEIRFFLDGLPLELSGYPSGIGNVPVNLIDRVDIYRGVVPIRFGSDALGGAVNLVSEAPELGLHGSASAEAGSFDTYRFTASLQELARDGSFVRGRGFFDTSANDYPANVQVFNDVGQLSAATVDLSHNHYTSGGGSFEAGVLDRSWAKKLVLRAFGTEYWRDIPFNIDMTVPYGAVTSFELNSGGSLNYVEDLGQRFTLDLTAAFTYDQTHFLDDSTCVYDWYGTCFRHRRAAGEIQGTPLDELQWENDVFGRLNATWQVAPAHTVRFSLAPTFTEAWGEERILPSKSSIDPLRARKYLTSVVGGAEYQVELFEDRVENVLFAKGYFQAARAVVPVFGSVLATHNHTANRGGFGDSLRYKLESWIWLKASYELATRLPSAAEVFGDGMLVLPNLDLAPETSHNANLSVTVDARHTPAGAFRADVNGFLREASQLIVLLSSVGQGGLPGSSPQFYGYQNVYGARSVGVEPAVGWTSPGEYVALDGNLTWQDFRNTSSQGEFGTFAGDRVPNRPWLFANGSVRLQYRGIASAQDEAALSFLVGYVNGFYRGWESVDILAYKQQVPSQVLCSLALIYKIPVGGVKFAATGEIQNMFDQPAFDFFGVQKPGRAFYAKLTAAF